MVRLALLLLAASTATADAEGWSASLAGGAFVVTPTFNPNHKRQTRPDNEVPESRVAGIDLTVSAELDRGAPVHLLLELGGIVGVGSDVLGLAQRIGAVVSPAAGLQLSAGVGLQELGLGADIEGEGRSLHWNPLAFVGARIGGFDAQQRYHAGIRIEGVRQCANWGDGCDWDSGVETERGFSFYMLIATVNAGIRF